MDCEYCLKAISESYFFTCRKCNKTVHLFCARPEISGKEDASPFLCKFCVSDVNFDTMIDEPLNTSEPENLNGVSTSQNAPKYTNPNDFFHMGEKVYYGKTNSQKAICKLCFPVKPAIEPRYGFYNVSKGSKKSLIHHLQKQHPEEYQKIDTFWCKKRKRSEESTAVGLSEINSQEDLVHQVMIWIIRAGMPFSVVEDPILRNILEEYTNHLDARKSRKAFPEGNYFRDQLPKIHKAYEQEKRLLLKQIDTKIAVTTDIWTSVDSKSFIGFTAHWITPEFILRKLLLAFIPFPEKYTSENIFEKYLEVVKKYNLTEKISAITLDNSLPNTKFIELVKPIGLYSKFFDKKENFHLRCLAHVFHLAAQTLVQGINGLELKGEPTLQAFLAEAKAETQGYFTNLTWNGEANPNCSQNAAPEKSNLFGGLRKLILKIKSSEKLIQTLHVQQKENSFRQSIPIPNMKAHWNSTYNMLKWAIENKKTIEKIATKEEKGALEWDLFKQLASLLEAFDSTTSLVCPSKSCSLSSGLISMIDASKLLNDQLSSISNEHQLYWPLKQTQEKIQKYFSFFLSDIYLIAIVLDPAYKLYYFEHYVPELYLKADQAIKAIFQEFQSEQLNGPAQETYVPVAVTKREKFVLNQKMQQSQKNLGELALYLNTEVTSTYILLFWKENAVKYPTLSKIARHIFACQATSGASEQEFNGAIDIFRVRQGHMLAETFSQLKETQTILKNDYEIKIV